LHILKLPRVRGGVAVKERSRFKAWLIRELVVRGAQLPPQPSWHQIREATRRYLVPRA
jgi:hypothetical protein